MRIISPFHDYYDGHQAHGQEPGIVYYRKSVVFRTDSPELKEFSRVNFQGSGVSLIGFCGQVIPHVVALEEYGPIKRGHYRERRQIVLVGCEAKEHLLKPGYRAVPGLNNLHRFLEDDSQQKIFADLFKKYKVPVWRVIPGRFLEFNPCLSVLNFQSYMPSHEAFQQLTSYIGTEFKERMAGSLMTDKEKVVSHGFDQKRSFRPKMK